MPAAPPEGGEGHRARCIGNVKDYVQRRLPIMSNKVVAPDLLADSNVPLKSLAV